MAEAEGVGVDIIYVLLVAHFVGDFICQSDWMAQNKSKRWDALALHVLVYAGVLGLFLLWTPTDAELLLIAVNAAAHFMQDAITSRINARLWFINGVRVRDKFKDVELSEGARLEDAAASYEVVYNDNRHWFFVGIGADQLLHYVTLFVTAGWWLR